MLFLSKQNNNKNYFKNLNHKHVWTTGACVAITTDMSGVTFATVSYSGSTTAEKDASCCAACDANAECEFWVRSVSTVDCFLRKSFTTYTTNSDRRGAHKSTPQCVTLCNHTQIKARRQNASLIASFTMNQVVCTCIHHIVGYSWMHRDSDRHDRHAGDHQVHRGHHRRRQGCVVLCALQGKRGV